MGPNYLIPIKIYLMLCCRSLNITSLFGSTTYLNTFGHDSTELLSFTHKISSPHLDITPFYVHLAVFFSSLTLWPSVDSCNLLAFKLSTNSNFWFLSVLAIYSSRGRLWVHVGLFRFVMNILLMCNCVLELIFGCKTSIIVLSLCWLVLTPVFLCPLWLGWLIWVDVFIICWSGEGGYN